jgi:hypothetical protein
MNINHIVIARCLLIFRDIRIILIVYQFHADIYVTYISVFFGSWYLCSPVLMQQIFVWWNECYILTDILCSRVAVGVLTADATVKLIL